jgi:hypothetical protein
VAALAHCTAAALAFGPRGILTLGATLADLRKLVQPLPDVLDLELVQPLRAEVGHDVQPRERLVPLVSLGRQVRLDDLAEPVAHVLADGRHVGRYWAFARLALQLEPLGVYLIVRLAVDPFALTFTVWRCDPGIGGIAVAVGEDGAFAVTAFAHADCSATR